MRRKIGLVSLVGMGALLAVREASATAIADDSFFHVSPSDNGFIGKRAEMIKFIWGSNGFPSTKMPEFHKVVPSPFSGLTNVQSVEAMRIRMPDNEYTIGYHFLPAARRNKLVVVHQGHGCDLAAGGIRETVIELVADGFGVLLLPMPRLSPPDGNIPDSGNCTAGSHSSMFNLALNGGNALQFFLTPVAAGINYLISTIGYPEVDMVGLSGGGWTTTLYAALDTRISSSFPVAGTLPLYLLSTDESPDLEQTYDSFYGPSGVAGYLDLYLLGSHGASARRQIQILNRHDSCCFNEKNVVHAGFAFEPSIRQYEARVKSAAAGTAGFFRTMIDEVATVHQISESARQNVILPVLRNAAFASTLATTIRSGFGAAGNLCLDVPDVGRPPQNNDPVNVYQCAGGTNQEFAIQSDGTIRVQRGGLCLDIPNVGRAPQNGDQLQVYACNGSINQQFDTFADGTVRSRWTGRLCLHVPGLGREPQNGDRLQVYQCDGSVNQQLGVNKPTTTLSSKWGPSLCIDVRDMGRPPQNQDPVQVYQCGGGPNQRFNLESDGTFRSEWGTLCLDIPDVGRPPQIGDKVQVYQCAGGLNQQFDVQANGSVKSRAANGLCLDIPNVGRATQNSDRLQVYTCNGGINQQFNINR